VAVTVLNSAGCLLTLGLLAVQNLLPGGATRDRLGVETERSAPRR